MVGPSASQRELRPQLASRARLGLATGQRESLYTWANLVTLVRTVIATVIFAIAAARESAALNLMGLSVYWALDVLDGELARRLRQETRLGAQMDILSDRLLVTFFYVNYLTMQPDLTVPIVLFLLEFCGLDLYLSNQFLRWPIVSPNYFYVVEPTVWKLNWSRPAKALNTGLVTALLVLAPDAWPVAAGAAIALMAVKVHSCVLLSRLPPPESWVRGRAS